MVYTLWVNEEKTWEGRVESMSWEMHIPWFTGKFTNASVAFLTGPWHSKLQNGLVPQKPIVPRDLQVCIFRKHQYMQPPAWGGPWTEGRNKGGILINTMAFMSGRCQRKPCHHCLWSPWPTFVTWACNRWEGCFEGRTPYSHFYPEAQSSLEIVKWSPSYILFYREGIFIFLRGKSRHGTQFLKVEDRKEKAHILLNGYSEIIKWYYQKGKTDTLD